MASIAVVIPTLNEAQHIGQLLHDLQSQTMLADSITVVDGGSTDGTKRQVAQFPRVRFLKTKASVAAQRNLGAQKTTESLILFVDADVRLTPTTIEKLLAFQKKEAVAIVLPRYKLPHTAHLVARALFAFLNSAMWFSQWGPMPAGAGPCMLVTRRCFASAGGFNQSLRITEDLDFVRRAGARGYTVRMAPVSVQVSDRRFHGKGLWPTTRLYLKVSWLYVFNRHTEAASEPYPFGQHSNG
jgi:hypothetical protein